MNRPLTLETPMDLPDGMGGVRRQWRALGRLWGDVSAGTVREVSGVYRVSVRVRVRAVPEGSASRPMRGQRLRDGTRAFRIRAVTDEGENLICHAEEET
ncbi:head-tail adaptor protein [Falsirhodobacter algicola]|nr:head-tail adaptor protein [Falsirhodobacter algicola]